MAWRSCDGAFGKGESALWDGIGVSVEDSLVDPVPPSPVAAALVLESHGRSWIALAPRAPEATIGE